MAKLSYWEQLRDPRWQRKRLEIMERDGFACRDCGDKTATLNVHHSRYRKGAAPWEYESYELFTLCEPCHEYRHDLLSNTEFYLGILSQAVLRKVFGYAFGWFIKIHPDKRITLPLDDDETVEGVAAASGVHWGDAEEVMRDYGAVGEDGKLSDNSILEAIETRNRERAEATADLAVNDDPTDYFVNCSVRA